MTKVVYLIASHTNPEQVVRLVKTLKTGNSSSAVVIHHDYSKSFLDPKAFEGIPNVWILDNHVAVQWGKFSMIKMKLHALEWMLAHLEFDWMVFLSGQDYPIQPLGQIEHFLETTPYDGFMSGVPIESTTPCGPVECPKATSAKHQCRDCITRYHYQYYELPSLFSGEKLPFGLKSTLNKIQKYFINVQSVIRFRSFPFAQNKLKTMIGIRPFGGPFSDDFKPYKGSQWFTLNYACLRYILQYVEANPQFVKYYEHTLFPDESFFQTILLNQLGLKIFNNNKRFIRWQSAESPNPDILKKQDLDSILTPDHHFARKFDLNIDAEILNLIDCHILKQMSESPVVKR